MKEEKDLSDSQDKKAVCKQLRRNQTWLGAEENWRAYTPSKEGMQFSSEKWVAMLVESSFKLWVVQTKYPIGLQPTTS